MSAKKAIQRLRARLTKNGQEKLDPTPMAPAVGYKKQPSMAENIRAMVQSERLAQEAAAAGYETFEEADDFDIPDDPSDPSTPYENDFDPPVKELKKRERDAKQAAKEAEQLNQKKQAKQTEPAKKPDDKPAD